MKSLMSVLACIYFYNFYHLLFLHLIQIGLAFYLSVTMTSFILLFGIILIFFSRKFIKKSQVLGKETFQLTQTYLAGMTDHFNGIKDIKSNSLEESHLRLVSFLK